MLLPQHAFFVYEPLVGNLNPGEGSLGERIVRDARTLATNSLSGRIGYEISLTCRHGDKISDAQDLVAFVDSYVREQDARIRPEETMTYGMWLLHFREAGDGTLDVWEKTAPGDDIQQGASIAMRIWREQHKMCAKMRAPFRPPQPSQLMAVTPGVREGRGLDGVRYSAPSHMSGWWLITDGYGGDINSVTLEHVRHLVEWRPELVKYLALPPGWSFRTGWRKRVWFDQSVADPPG